MSKTSGESDSIIMPTEPLEDDWREKWDDEALDYRLSRFGLRLEENMEGYTVAFASSGNPLSLLDMDYHDCSHNDVCDLVQDLELTERLKRSGLESDCSPSPIVWCPHGLFSLQVRGAINSDAQNEHPCHPAQPRHDLS